MGRRRVSSDRAGERKASDTYGMGDEEERQANRDCTEDIPCRKIAGYGADIIGEKGSWQIVSIGTKDSRPVAAGKVLSFCL